MGSSHADKVGFDNHQNERTRSNFPWWLKSRCNVQRQGTVGNGLSSFFPFLGTQLLIRQSLILVTVVSKNGVWWGTTLKIGSLNPLTLEISY